MQIKIEQTFKPDAVGTFFSTKHILGSLLILLSLGVLFIIPFIPLEGNKPVRASFLDDIESKYALVFFGYPGCGSVCPVTMSGLNQIYRTYQREYSDPFLKVAFVNLFLDIETQLSRDYAQSFHPDFYGYGLSEKNQREIREDFGIAPLPRHEGELTHTNYTYLLQREKTHWEIKYVYDESNLPVLQVLNHLKTLRSMGKGER